MRTTFQHVRTTKKCLEKQGDDEGLSLLKVRRKRPVAGVERGLSRLPPQPPGMALSVLVVLLLAVLYEGTKVAKAKLLHKTLENLPNTTSQQLILESDQDSTGSRSTPADGHRLRWFLCYFGQSLVHVIQVVLGYFVMLAIMSYNTWIFLGAIVGLGVGYYLAYPLLSMT
ncbi:probable low affinity copper uptake protein 2 isoform X3 [Microtus ochrogaster]|uniref:Copper transport protein n=1 Tax=Microtus ochrogaster TaxID=79684 RepID=A0ABM1U7D7_MICOH|nr:probable low affinity copper uptake protein 2 isoform X3 [Microtus ochrogaster]